MRPRLEIDIRQGVELVHHDIDIVAADAGAKCRDALAFVQSGDRMELSVARLALLTVEM